MALSSNKAIGICALSAVAGAVLMYAAMRYYVDPQTPPANPTIQGAVIASPEVVAPVEIAIAPVVHVEAAGGIAADDSSPLLESESAAALEARLIAMATPAPTVKVLEYQSGCQARPAVERKPTEGSNPYGDSMDPMLIADSSSIGYGEAFDPGLEQCHLPLEISVAQAPKTATSVAVACDVSWKLGGFDDEEEYFETKHFIEVPVTQGIGKLKTEVVDIFPSDIVVSYVMRTDTSCAIQ